MCLRELSGDTVVTLRPVRVLSALWAADFLPSDKVPTVRMNREAGLLDSRNSSPRDPNAGAA